MKGRKVNGSQVVKAVWADKWEAILGIAGLIVSAGTIGPLWVRILSALLALALVADVAGATLKTMRLAREKHIPLVVIVGREWEQARAVLNEVLEIVDDLGFRPSHFAKDYDIEQSNWLLHQEASLPDTPGPWMDLGRRFLHRVQRLERLKGRKVFHVFLNCPAVLALGLGANVGTRHLVVLYHWQPGGRGSPYVPVHDLSFAGEGKGTPATRLKSRLSSPPETIAVQRPESLTEEVFVALQLASPSPESAFGRVAAQEGAALVVIRNCFDNVLPLNADWTQVAREVAGVLTELLNEPTVRRIHLALSCPLPLAFAIGMALGVHAPICVYNWYADRGAYAPVIELDKMRSLGRPL